MPTTSATHLKASLSRSCWESDEMVPPQRWRCLCDLLTQIHRLKLVHLYVPCTYRTSFAPVALLSSQLQCTKGCVCQHPFPPAAFQPALLQRCCSLVEELMLLSLSSKSKYQSWSRDLGWNQNCQETSEWAPAGDFFYSSPISHVLELSRAQKWVLNHSDAELHTLCVLAKGKINMFPQKDYILKVYLTWIFN